MDFLFDFFASIHSCISGYTISVSFELEYSTSNIWCCSDCRGGSRAAATSKMERLVIIVKGLTIITKRSILDVAAVLDPRLDSFLRFQAQKCKCFIRDTKDLIMELSSIFKIFPENSFVFTMGVWSLYTNIDHEKEAEGFFKKLKERKNKLIPSLDLKSLLPRFCNLCPDLKSLPRFEIPKPAPICNPSCPNL